MFLEYLKFILYGLIQGFTEFIPVVVAHFKVISLFLELMIQAFFVSIIQLKGFGSDLVF